MPTFVFPSHPRFAIAICFASALTVSTTRGDDETKVPRVDRAEVPLIANRATAADRLASDHPVARAQQAIAECQKKYADVSDYTCTFVKRERVDGKLHAQHVMKMKARTRPKSIYFKFQTPNKGREAIYVAGRHNDKVVAHDVGLGRLIAGTMNLDPHGSTAMQANRHPVTEAGVGALIDNIVHYWALELTPQESVITFNPDMMIGPRRCTMIESVHPEREDRFLFHKVRLFIDHEQGLPIRFEAYDWPKHSGATPELVEEYSYLDLKLNVGLSEHDFDPANKSYSFGRF
jgi:Protein of unknown function (DUF1571)